MMDFEEKPSIRAHFSDVRLLVLHRAVVLLLLTRSCGGQSQATVSPQSIRATIGDDVILPCHLDATANGLDVTVEWIRPDLNPRFVHLRRGRQTLLNEQNPSYKGRTSLSDNRLKCGDLSLKLSNVGVSDAGVYKCLVPGSTTESVVQLVVGDVLKETSCSAVRVPVSLVACFLCLITVALVAWKIKKTEMGQDKSEPGEETSRSKNLELQLQVLMADQEAKEHFMSGSERMKYLDTAMEKLEEEKKRSEEELTCVEGVISMLKDQKNNLRKQKETIKSALEVMGKWKEDDKKKVETGTVKSRIKENIERVKDLRRRMSEQEEQLTNTDKLLWDTEDMMMRMTERKGKLEREREQIEKHMKENEKKREKVQRKLESEETDAPQSEPLVPH